MASQEHWAFLLQKAGDRSWQPLNSSEVSIKAGRYRIIARSSRRNADVEIRIAHTNQPHQSNPPYQTRTRTAKTNEKGFLLVLPFNNMQPGQWEFRCASPATNELLGDRWQHAVKLNVQALASNTSPTNTSPETLPQPESAQTATKPETTTHITPVKPASSKPVAPPPAAIANPVAELENLFSDPPNDTPAVPKPPASPAKAAPVDAVSLEELFGNTSAESLGLTSSNDLANDLAEIAQPIPDQNLDADPWDATPPNHNSTDSLTELEIVTGDDETLLDLSSSETLAPRLNTEPLAAAPLASNPPDLTPPEADSDDSDSDDDDFSVFDELFSVIDDPEDDLSNLNQLLKDVEPSGNTEINIVKIGTEESRIANRKANKIDNVITFTDVDALETEAETSNIDAELAIEASNAEDLKSQTSNVSNNTLEDASESASITATTTEPAASEGTESAAPEAVADGEEITSDHPPSLWGVGTRLGANAAMANASVGDGESNQTVISNGFSEPATGAQPQSESITASPADVSALIDDSDIVTSKATAPTDTPSESPAIAATSGTITPLSQAAITTPLDIASTPPAPSEVLDQTDSSQQNLVRKSSESQDPDTTTTPAQDAQPIRSTDSNTLLTDALNNVNNQATPPLEIILEPTMYNFQSGEVLMVYGQVVADTSEKPQDEHESKETVIPQGEIVVKLVDPQTATQITEYRQPIERQSLPIAIAAPLQIGQDIQAQLLVGEVAIWDDGIEELTQQTFTATAAVDELMATIAAQQSESGAATDDRQGDPPLPPVDFGFFNYIGDAPANAPEPAPLTKRESMQDVELPTPDAATSKTDALSEDLDEDLFSVDDIELENPLASPADSTSAKPTDSDSKAATDRPPDSTIDDVDTPIEALDPLDLRLNVSSNSKAASNASTVNNKAQITTTNEPTNTATPVGITSTSGQPLPDDWFDLPSEDEASDNGVDTTTPVDTTATPETNANRPEDSVKADSAAIDESSKTAQPSAIATDNAPATDLNNVDPVAQEVVVDELPEALPTPQTAQAETNPLLIPENEAVPEPTIEILETGDLVTGQAVHVRVKVPSILPKLYVKLWINDRQSRTLLDGPRWMVDFMPNGHNELESMTQLTVPFGSLEIQVAAITVEATTKRESYRTAIDRAVVPPNFEDEVSDLRIDEL